MSSLANELCEFYCLSYNNKERKAAMASRFQQLNLHVNFYDGVNFEDNRILLKDNNNDNTNVKKCWSCMYGHLDMINKFLNETDKTYGVFCEDDIYLHKDFAENLINIAGDFRTMNLDVLLLGYLTSFKIEDYYQGYRAKLPGSFEKRPHKYHNYPDELWGTQMYMISRPYAQSILDKYYHRYAEQSLDPSLKMTPFSSDWTITKDGNRALVYPMCAVEDGKTHYDHSGQEVYHQQCFALNYDDKKHI